MHWFGKNQFFWKQIQSSGLEEVALFNVTVLIRRKENSFVCPQDKSKKRRKNYLCVLDYQQNEISTTSSQVKVYFSLLTARFNSL